MIRRAHLAMLAVVASLLACDRRDKPSGHAPSAAPLATPSSAPTTEPRPDATTDVGVAPTPPRSAAIPAAPTEPHRTFRHATRGFTLAYPPALTPHADATGVSLRSAPSRLPAGTTRPVGVRNPRVEIDVHLEASGVVDAAKRTNPALATAFPGGTEESFKPSSGFAGSAPLGGSTAYTFLMGSHGSGERVTLVRITESETFVIRCSITSDDLHPILSEEQQIAACDMVMHSLRR